eukprot:TRINITY_DN21165_c0_g1_i4.p3 TRINITY_DN21165_c0_g1~~TRINITY_DN21165_c0_g1_i4.p3  ORF type:complete len:193 (+),score=1.72 TRINITY_DN21165_c0_g1_i4:156-734(+)
MTKDVGYPVKVLADKADSAQAPGTGGGGGALLAAPVSPRAKGDAQGNDATTRGTRCSWPLCRPRPSRPSPRPPAPAPSRPAASPASRWCWGCRPPGRGSGMPLAFLARSLSSLVSETDQTWTQPASSAKALREDDAEVCPLYLPTPAATVLFVSLLGPAAVAGGTVPLALPHQSRGMPICCAPSSPPCTPPY